MKRLILVLLFSACSKEQFTSNLRSAGVVDAAALQPRTLDVICDYGGGSSGCTSESLRAVLFYVTPTLAPGSVVRLHGMADDVADAKELARYEITASRKKTRHAIEDHRKRQTAEITRSFLRAAAPVFTNDDRRASPIAETIAAAVLAGDSSGGEHRVLVLTDARQVSKRSVALGRIDLECGRIPTVDDFAERLAHLLPRASWNGVLVEFAYVKLEPVANNRCDATVERYEAIKTLWTQSLSRLGVKVTWSMGPVNAQ